MKKINKSKLITAVLTASALTFGFAGGVIASSDTFNSKGRIESNDIVFDSADFVVMQNAFESGKEATMLQTIDAVKSNPENFGISMSAKSIASKTGAGGGHAGSVSYATVPAGYDLAIVVYHDCDNTAGLRSTSGLTQIGWGSDPSGGSVQIWVMPLNGASANVPCGGGWGDAYAVGAVKLK